MTQKPLEVQQSCPTIAGISRGSDISQCSWRIFHRDRSGSGVSGGGAGISLSMSFFLKSLHSRVMKCHIPRCQKYLGCMSMSVHHRSVIVIHAVVGVMSPRPPSAGGFTKVAILYCCFGVVM